MKPTILTAADLARIPSHLSPMQAAGGLRMGCPFHGSDKQRSLVVYPDGRFVCYGCQEWGFTEERDQQFKADRQVYKPTNVHKGVSIPRLNLSEAACAPLDSKAIQTLARWQTSLPQAAECLKNRAVPLDLAARYGLGFKPQGEALYLSDDGKKRFWDARVIAPHTNPQGEVVSLYSRAIVDSDYKHAHLQMPKGHFNSAVFKTKGEPLYICEGVFDALSLLAVGFKRVVAVFGLGGFRWDWVENETDIVLALDQDSAGQKAIPDFLIQAAQRGIRVSKVTPEEVGFKKDLNEALQANCLHLRPEPSTVTAAAPKIIPPDAPPEGLSPEHWLNFVGLCKQVKDTGDYSDKELYSLPTFAIGSDAGVLWQAAGFDFESMSFLPDRVVLNRPGSPLTITRLYLRPSGVLPDH